ncbi:polysaccharide deacetylase family protein [Neorhodopirellula pilleata]|nr:hypothetical protein [Neorhodopirellula pilleata]
MTRFAFGGAAGEVLGSYFKRDCQQARLSNTFKLYYRLRPLIPVPARHFLQRRRNRVFDLSERCDHSTDFLRDFGAAVETEREQLAVHPWPDQYETVAVLTHDVETKEGLRSVDKLAALEERYGLRSAWNVVPYKYRVDLGILRDLQDRGHEIGVHGFNHDGRLFESKRIFDRRTIPINRALRDFRATGFRAPMVHRNLEWQQALDVDYDASTFDYDPFQAMPGGVGGVWPFIVGKLVELPYTLPQDHTLLVTLGETEPTTWFRKFEYLRSLSGMAMLITHPDYLDTPGRLDVYRRFLEYVAEQSDCWTTLPHEVARWWRIRDSLKIQTCETGQLIVGPESGRARAMRLGNILQVEPG